MKPSAFTYRRPESLGAALEILAAAPNEAKILAGGQSLIPAMNFRLAYPEVLVDITRIEGLQSITVEGGWLRLGATVTQRQLERSAEVAVCPALVAALPWVGHIQTRNRGTVCGSLAHADPAAELPAVAVAIGAEIDVLAATGSRVIPAGDFFQGPFTTNLGADEIIEAVRFPVAADSIGMCEEVVRRHGDFAIAGTALQAQVADDSVASVRIAAFGVGGAPQRLIATEAILTGSEIEPGLAAVAGQAAAEEINEPWSDIHGSGDFRRGAIGALVARMVSNFPA